MINFDNLNVGRSYPTIWTSLLADDKFLPISAVKVAGGAIIFDFDPEIQFDIKIEYAFNSKQ